MSYLTIVYIYFVTLVFISLLLLFRLIFEVKQENWINSTVILIFFQTSHIVQNAKKTAVIGCNCRLINSYYVEVFDRTPLEDI